MLAYVALARLVDAHSTQELQSKAEGLLHTLSENSVDAAFATDERRLRQLLSGHQDLHLAVLDVATDRVMLASSSLASRSAQQLSSTQPSDTPLTWSVRPAYPVSSMVVVTAAGSGPQIKLILSQDRSNDYRLLAKFMQGAAIAFGGFWVVLMLSSWWIARMELAPLARFGVMAARIGSASLGERIATNDLPDDLAALGMEFNAMLARIEEGMQRVSNFSADLAHEIRTPIGILYGRTQIALSRSRSAEELRDVLEDNVVELERISRLVTDMLFVMQEDDVSAQADLVDVNLRVCAQTVVDFLALTEEARAVRVSVHGEATLVAHEPTLQRALMNLLSNAIRHADEGSEVSIAIAQIDREVTVDVVNIGEPIPEMQRMRIFDRFVRLDEARTREAGGSGLGLAIVAAVAKRYHGNVTVTCEPGRKTRFRLQLIWPSQLPSAARSDA